MTETKTLGNRPIVGDPGETSLPAEQWGEEKFIEMLDAVFAADPEVTALGWTQYTPGFNDGDPCTFDVHCESLVILGEIPESISYDTVRFSSDEDEVYTDDPRVLSLSDRRPPGEYGRDPDGVWGYQLTDPDAPVDPLYAAGTAFYKALTQGHFDHVVMKHFGDPASVVATREDFKVGYYECGY